MNTRFKNNRLNFKRNRRRLRRRRRRARHNVPMLSNRPQCMGLGTGTLYVSYNYFHSVTTLTVKQVSLQDILDGSQELLLKKNEFMYCKILFIKAILMPRNIQNSTSMDYMLLNWTNNHDYSSSQVINSDSSKLLPVYQIKPKVFTFYPPNMIVNTQTPHNLREYSTTAVLLNYPGWFYFYGPSAFTIRFEVKIRFRGAQQFQVNQLTQDLQKIHIIKNQNNQKYKMEEEDEIKEEEEEINKENDIKIEEQDENIKIIKNYENKKKTLGNKKSNKNF